MRVSGSVLIVSQYVSAHFCVNASFVRRRWFYFWVEIRTEVFDELSMCESNPQWNERILIDGTVIVLLELRLTTHTHTHTHAYTHTHTHTHAYTHTHTHARAHPEGMLVSSDKQEQILPGGYRGIPLDVWCCFRVSVSPMRSADSNVI